MTGAEDELSVRLQIVLLLAPCSRWKGNKACPRDMTQVGLAENLGLPRPHVTVELGRAVKKGLIEFARAYVNGSKRQVKVYNLTATGESLAVQLTQLRRERPSLPPRDGGSGGDKGRHVEPEPRRRRADERAENSNPAVA
jgi:DNA-binding MarR family transcriptional regulator